MYGKLLLGINKRMKISVRTKNKCKRDKIYEKLFIFIENLNFIYIEPQLCR